MLTPDNSLRTSITARLTARFGIIVANRIADDIPGTLSDISMGIKELRTAVADLGGADKEVEGYDGRKTEHLREMLAYLTVVKQHEQELGLSEESVAPPTDGLGLDDALLTPDCIAEYAEVSASLWLHLQKVDNSSINRGFLSAYPELKYGLLEVYDYFHNLANGDKLMTLHLAVRYIHKWSIVHTPNRVLQYGLCHGGSKVVYLDHWVMLGIASEYDTSKIALCTPEDTPVMTILAYLSLQYPEYSIESLGELVAMAEEVLKISFGLPYSTSELQHHILVICLKYMDIVLLT